MKISEQVIEYTHNITDANHAHIQHSACLMQQFIQLKHYVPATEAWRTQCDFGRPILIEQDQIVYQPICSVYFYVYRFGNLFDNFGLIIFPEFRIIHIIC